MWSRVIKSFAVLLSSRTILKAVTIALVVQAAFLQPASRVYAAEPQTGIDCGCDATGIYRDPAAPVALSLQPVESPNHVYQVETQYSPGTLSYLRVIKGGVEVISATGLPNNAKWSFSPDNDRFVIYFIENTYAGSQTTYWLYNLTRASNRNVPVWSTTTTLVDTEAAFSPHGKYFQYAEVDEGTVWLTIRDAKTGARIYEISFTAAPPPSGSTTRVASWSYSPDTSDRTFVYAYANSQIPSSVYWGIVNLAAGTLVRDELLANTVGSQGLRPFWKFSPCGDAIGLVNTAVTPINVRLFATSDGTPLNAGGQSVSTTSILSLMNNPDIHYVDTGSTTTYPLADNTADEDCSGDGGGGGGTTPRRSGIECGCSATGSYKNPATPVPLSLQPQDSPHGKYRVETQFGSGGSTYLNVVRMSDRQTIVSLGAVPNSTYWGFSPDDDRFAVYSIQGYGTGTQTITYRLYNLVRAFNPGSTIWETTTSLVDTEASFSPHGRYFQYTEVDLGTTLLTIRDARTGAWVYETSFTAAPPPSGDKMRVASWGYSPDTADRTFFYAYANSQIPSSVQWGVVNLAAGRLVNDEMLVNAIGSQGLQPFWKFSPCGDTIGLANTAVTPTNIRLFATSDGASLNAGGLDIMTGDTLALKNNLSSHYADTGSATYPLADNTADVACTVPPGEVGIKALSIIPASVTGGVGTQGTARGTVTLTLPAPSGGVDVNLASDIDAAQVQSSVRVPAGYSSANFNITTSEVSEETTAYISASRGSTTNTATLTITPSPIASLTMSHYGIIAGTIETGTVTLRDPASAGGAVVNFSTSGSFRTLTWVRVPAGETSASFEVTANLNISNSQARLTATYLGASKTINLTLLRASSLAVTPVEVTGGADAVTVTAVLPVAAPEGGIVVPLNVAPAGIVELPPSVTIESGQTTGSSTASTIAIDENTDVTILAGVPDDSESPTAVVHVLASVPTALPGGPYVVIAGQPVTLIGDGIDPKGEALTFAWDLDGDETFETAGNTAVFTDTAGENREVPVWLLACNTSGRCGTGLTFIRVRNPGQVWITPPVPLQDVYMRNLEFGIPDGPTPVLLEGFGEVIDVVGGWGFMAALRADGTVWTMGDNYFGQTGDASLPTGPLPGGYRAISTVPVQAAISDVVAIASRGEAVMALKRDGTVWTWGSNQYLGLADETDTLNPHPTPRQVQNLSGVVSIAADRLTSFALTRKGEIYGWGYGDPIFGRGCYTINACKITTIRDAVALQVTNDWAIVLKRDGTVWFWGGYDPVTFENRYDPEQIEGFSGITAISAARDSFLALKDDGTVWGFGSNDYGQLGLNPWPEYPNYVRDHIGPLQIPGLAGVRSIASGGALQSALLQDGTVAGWGRTAPNCPTGLCDFWLPSHLEGLTNVQAVAVGDDFRLAIIPGTPTSRTATVTVQPGEAATLPLPNGRGQIEFPAGLVAVPTTFTYTEQNAPSQSLGSYSFAGLSFTLVATDPDGNPVTSFPVSYTLRLTYRDSSWQNAGIADESLLNLTYWDTAAGQWATVLPCDGCLLDPAQNSLVAVLNHLTEFALLAPADVAPPTASVTVQPGESASLTLPNGRGQIDFPAGLVSVPTTFMYTEQDAPSQALGSYTFAGLSFTLVATDTDGNLVTSFPASYTLRLTYQDSDWQGAGIADESLLNLTYWDTAAGQWVNVLPCEGCSLDPEQNSLVAVLDHLTEFALIGSIASDAESPTTSASVSPQANASGWYVGPVTVTLSASDSGSGTHNTEYDLNGAGWTSYTTPFVVSTESTSSTAHNTVLYRSTDKAGNVEETRSLTIQIDTTAPTVGASVPLSGNAVQGGIPFGVNLADALSGPAGAALSIREADGASGKVIGCENLAAVFNSTSGHWELAQPFDTTQLPDGFYVLLATGKDVAGNEVTETIPFSVRNWAVLELLPSRENNKAGRTMPVKFSLRVAQEVDPAQPFVYNEELTITIYEAGQPTPVLQSSTFGSGATDYRIDAAEQTYITNFQTLMTPMQYTAEILRDALSIGTFGFQTTEHRVFIPFLVR